MAWTDEYIGVPFLPNGRDRDGLDCWGLVMLVYAEQLGIELRDIYVPYDGPNREVLLRVSVALEEERQRWDAVEHPKEFDAILLRATGAITSHVGVCLGGGKFMHIMQGRDVTIERIDGMQWGKRVVGFYRYE